MTQEEKAKAYDKKLAEAKEMLKDGGVSQNTIDYIQKLYPELVEPEDERIRKHLLYHFRNKTKKEWNGIPVKDILAWLEKQGEHANFRNKIQIGDKVTRNKDGVLVNLSQLNRVAKKDEKQGEQKPNTDFSDLRTWKPSDKQMDALENAIMYGEVESIGILSLLYNDLKKLK